ncbi:MAG: transposase, partial [Candidatus Omnitrophota bacterium]
MPRTEADKMIRIQRINVPKIYIEGALYSVTSHGDNEDVIFKEKGDYEKYLELLKKYKEQYGFKLYAFCLMPNHLHLLFELKLG